MGFAGFAWVGNYFPSDLILEFKQTSSLGAQDFIVFLWISLY